MHKLRTIFLSIVAVVATSLLAVNAQVPGVNSTLATVFTMAYDNSTMMPTYSATFAFTPAAAATDVCSLSGSASKTVKVRRILFSGVNSAVQSDPLVIVKRSTAYSGAGTGLTKLPYDSSNAASTVNLAEAWTTNPTVGTLVGVVSEPFIQWGNLTTGLGSINTVVFGQLGQPIVLRGIAQSVAVNLGGLTFTTPSVTCTFEWTEQ